jgi:glycosyltransferase involved in cell wall biosynthesis
MPVFPIRRRSRSRPAAWTCATFWSPGDGARPSTAPFVWCGQLRPATYPAKWLNERLGIPYGILVHGGDLLGLQHKIHQSRVKRGTARSLLASAAVIVANSRWTRDLCHVVLGELGLDGHEGRVRIVPLGTDPEQFQPGLATARVRQRYGLGPGRWLLTVARLVPHKGVDVTLHALAGLAPDHPDLAVVGRASNCLARGTGHGLGPVSASHLTDVSDTDLPAPTAASLRGVRAGRTGRGGFGIALLEASASDSR